MARCRRANGTYAALFCGLLVGAGAAGGIRSAHADHSFDVAMAAPAMDPYGMVVVERAKTPGKFEFGTSLTFGWAKDPFRPTLSDQNNGRMDSQFNLIQHQLTVDLGFYLGFTDFLSVAVAMPMGVNIYDDNAVGSPEVPQPMSAANPTGFPAATGLYYGQPRQSVPISTAGARDPRFALKARFFTNQFFEIGTILEVTVPLGDGESFLGEKNATFKPRLLGGFMFSRVNIALSFGAIVREASELLEPTNPMVLRFAASHELSYGIGVSVMAHRMLSLGIESFGTIPVAGDATSATSAMLGAIYFRPVEKWRVTVAGGGGLLGDNPRNADGRLIVGLAYSPSPRDGGMR